MPDKITPPQMVEAIAAGEPVIVKVPDFDDRSGMSGVYRLVISAREANEVRDHRTGERTQGRWMLLFEDDRYPAALITSANYGYERKEVSA